MNIKLLLFGSVADAVGFRNRAMTVRDSVSVDSVLDEFRSSYPQLSTQTLLVAVNEQYADAGRPLHDGDEVAIFTPVSGG